MKNSSSHCKDCTEDCDCEKGLSKDFTEKQDNLSHSHDFDEETREDIQEIQLMEQNFEQIMQQKHLFNMEINETDLALREINNSEGEVFKVVGNQVIIKCSKDKLSSDLKHKLDLLKARMSSLEKQEKEISNNIEKLRLKIMARISKRN